MHCSITRNAFFWQNPEIIMQCPKLLSHVTKCIRQGETNHAAHPQGDAACDFHARHHGRPCRNILLRTVSSSLLHANLAGQGGNHAGAGRAPHDEEAVARDEQKAAAGRGWRVATASRPCRHGREVSSRYLSTVVPSIPRLSNASTASSTRSRSPTPSPHGL